MNETPYELLIKKSRQRKIELFNSIEENSLRHRSITYNTHAPNDPPSRPENNSQDKQKHQKQNSTNFTNCLKKSYYYRKFLNQSAEGHLTHEQFSKLKETFDRIHQGQTQRNPGIFREIWENEMQRKYSLRSDEQKELYLTVEPKTREKFMAISGRSSPEGKKNSEESKRKMDSICQIARKRKLAVNFDLEVQGNKKDIRVKDQVTANSPNKLTNIKDKLEGYVLDLHQYKQTQALPESLKKKSACTFFKRFQSAMAKQEAHQRPNSCFKIHKIRPETTNNMEDEIFYQSSSSARRQSLTRELGDAIGQRYIRSSWNGCKDTRKDRYYKVQTAQKCRVSIRRHKRVLGGNYTNDIQGWNVKPQNEDENNQIFGL